MNHRIKASSARPDQAETRLQKIFDFFMLTLALFFFLLSDLLFPEKTLKNHPTRDQGDKTP